MAKGTNQKFKLYRLAEIMLENTDEDHYIMMPEIMDSLNLRLIEQTKISCAKKLFNEMSTSNVKYHDVDSYQNLLNVMKTL